MDVVALLAALGALLGALVALVGRYVSARRGVGRVHHERGQVHRELTVEAQDGQVTRVSMEAGSVEDAERLIQEFLRANSAATGTDTVW
jgi:hypothetical protein